MAISALRQLRISRRRRRKLVCCWASRCASALWMSSMSSTSVMMQSGRHRRMVGRSISENCRPLV